MRVALALVVAGIGTYAHAAQASSVKLRPHRFEVLHGDPWAIKAMLEGTPLRSPEIGVLLSMGGAGAGLAAGAASQNALFKSGTLMVNPTDNSIWWFPKSGDDKSPK